MNKEERIERILAERDDYLTYICRECTGGPCVGLFRDLPDFCPFCSLDEDDRSRWQIMEE